MIPRKNSKDDEINTSNYFLFDEDSPKNENNNSNNNKNKKIDNPKSTVIKRKKNFNVELNQFLDIDIDLNNLNLNNKDNNDTFNNFKLFEDSHRGTKIMNIENNNNINNKNNLYKSINPYMNNENDEDIKEENKNNNNININNDCSKNMVNINNISNKKEFKKKNQKEDSKFENNLKINNKKNINEENVNNSIDDEKKTNIIINKIKNSKTNKNDISEKSDINKGNQKFLNKNIQLNLQNNISDKNEIDKIKQNMKLMNNKNINKTNKTFIFSNSKSPLRQKESEEEKKEREIKEKERNYIRDRLKCYLCFGKINKARLCLNCKKIACENCVKNMLLKHAKCLNCKKPATLDTIVLLPFMDDLTNFFINIENNNNKNKEKKEIQQRNYIIDEDDNDENNIKNINNNIKIKEDKKEEISKTKCKKHKDKYLEYYCFQCKEYLCPKCLLFFNQSVIVKHHNHSIIPIIDFKKYNIKEAIDEYNKLNKSKNDLDILLSECKLRIKKLTIKKDIALKNIEDMKKELEWNFVEKINLLRDLSTKIENKKENIENSIDSVPNSFSNIISQKDFNQGKQICKELKKLNAQLIPLDEIKQKISSRKFNLYFETFESEEINISLPDNGNYLEELKIFDNEIKLIPEHQSKLKIDLLGGNFIFTLSIKIEDEYYNKYHPTFKGYFILINPDTKCEYANFIGSIYTNGIQILSIELEFDNVKKIIGEKNKFKIICCVDKIYYK